MIAVDWGTSSFRAYRLRADGEVIDRRSAPAGILSVQNGQFAQTLESHVGDWLNDGEHRIVMSGMIGARQGWVEAPYCECPAGFTQISAKVKQVSWGTHRAWITPGVCWRDSNGVHDVMRGEEMQILGSLDRLPPDKAIVCLPGTHSKWVEVQGGAIVGFATHMTGEVFALLKQHSILARMMVDGAFDETAFKSGLRRAREPGGLLHHLFGVRAQGLFGELAESQSASYLSGLLIGSEFRSALETQTARKVFLLGTSDLMRLYTLACEDFDREPVTLDPESVVRGLFMLSQSLP